MDRLYRMAQDQIGRDNTAADCRGMEWKGRNGMEWNVSQVTVTGPDGL